MDKPNQLHAMSTLCFRIQAERTSGVLCRKEKQTLKTPGPNYEHRGSYFTNFGVRLDGQA